VNELGGEAAVEARIRRKVGPCVAVRWVCDRGQSFGEQFRVPAANLIQRKSPSMNRMGDRGEK
jgi:hypothetical protein